MVHGAHSCWCKVSILKTITGCELGQEDCGRDCINGASVQVFETMGDNNYKAIGYALLSRIDALGKGNERLR